MDEEESSFEIEDVILRMIEVKELDIFIFFFLSLAHMFGSRVTHNARLGMF